MTSGRQRGSRSQGEIDDELVVRRDAEESIVAALQESDTAVEAMHDSGADARSGADPDRRWKFGIAGLVLAALGILVARRRR